MGISDLILMRNCRSCELPGTLLCERCRRRVEDTVVPQRLFAGSLPVHCAVRYESTARSIVLAAKRTGAAECVAVMARLARVALADCLDDLAVDGRICVVPLHSGAKTRAAAGQDLVVAVLRQAMKGLPAPRGQVQIADVLDSSEQAATEGSESTATRWKCHRKHSCLPAYARAGPQRSDLR